jgi:hypothetical protein
MPQPLLKANIAVKPAPGNAEGTLSRHAGKSRKHIRL